MPGITRCEVVWEVWNRFRTGFNKEMGEGFFEVLGAHVGDGIPVQDRACYNVPLDTCPYLSIHVHTCPYRSIQVHTGPALPNLPIVAAAYSLVTPEPEAAKRNAA